MREFLAVLHDVCPLIDEANEMTREVRLRERELRSVGRDFHSS